jgi:hypothetical protein
LAAHGLRDHVFILAEDNPPKLKGAAEQFGVRIATPRRRKPRVMGSGTCTSM